MVFDIRPGPIGGRIARISTGKLKRHIARYASLRVIFSHLEGRPGVGEGWDGALARWEGLGAATRSGERGGERKWEREEKGRDAQGREEEEKKRPVRFDRSDPVLFDSAGPIQYTKF